MTLELSLQNAMIAGSYQVQKHPPDMSILEGISSLDVLYSNPYQPDGDYALREFPTRWAVRCCDERSRHHGGSGSVSTAAEWSCFPQWWFAGLGTNMPPTVVLLGVLRDGTVVMGRAKGASVGDLQNRIWPTREPLRSALGGGGGLAGKRPRVSQRDLLLIQRVGRKPGGFYARSMDPGVHTIMGIRKGRAYAAWCTTRSGLDIQLIFIGLVLVVYSNFSHGSNVFLTIVLSD